MVSEKQHLVFCLATFMRNTKMVSEEQHLVFCLATLMTNTKMLSEEQHLFSCLATFTTNTKTLSEVHLLVCCLPLLLFVFTYVFNFLSLCIHYKVIHYVIIDICSSGWFCIRQALVLNLCYNSGCLEFFSHSVILSLQPGECWLITNPFRRLFQY